MLTVEGIYKTYEGDPLLRGVSFSVAAGETVCLLGPSGSGKSTLLRIIAGLEPTDAGRVLWQGQDLMGVPVHLRRFGLMFQDYALFPHRNVVQNVGFGLRMQHLPKPEIEKRVAQALEQVNLIGFEQRRVTDLSGGEQQRVALARALAPQPRLLMLDEPLGALDRALREQLVKELRGLLNAASIPAIYVTHDQEEAFSIADRLILLHNGIVQQIGSPQQLYLQPASIWVAQFLGLNNLIEGEVVNLNPFTVKTSLGIWQIPHPVSEVGVGQLVTLLLRPSGASLEPGAGYIKVSGTVVDCLFEGEFFGLDLSLANRQCLRFNLSQPVPVRTEIELFFAPQDVLCLIEELPHG